MAKVFLSYSREDTGRVQRIAEALQADGLDVWWDHAISGGSDFSQEIEQALFDADVVVVAWSRSSCRSPWVRDEAGHGRDRSRLVPISLDGTEPPLGFRQFQTIDFVTKSRQAFDSAVRALKESIRRKTGEPETQVELPRAGRRARIAFGVFALFVALFAAGASWFASGDREQGSAEVLAVMPFETIGSDQQGRYFGDGLAEDIGHRLSLVPDLRIISRSSAGQFKSAGEPLSKIREKLGATKVLDGSVRRIGDRVRVVVHLIDAKSNEELWSESYDRQLSDVFAIQSSIATEVASALQARLSDAARDLLANVPTANPAAYDEYLQGRHLFAQRTSDGLASAVVHFRKAIALQPDFAAAYAGLSDAYAHLEDHGTMKHNVAFPLAIEAARRAIALDPASAEARASLGHIYVHQRRWEEAEGHLRQALDRNPNYATAQHWLGHLLRLRGRTAEAVERHRTAWVLDPLSRVTNMNLALSLASDGQLGPAIRQYERTLDLYPDHATTLEFMSWALSQAKRHEEALAARRKAFDLYVSDGSDARKERAGLAEILANAGRRDEAMQILAQSERSAKVVEPDPAYMARGYAAIGDIDSALRWIRLALSRDWSDLDQYHAADPLFAAVRRDPRYSEILRTIDW